MPKRQHERLTLDQLDQRLEQPSNRVASNSSMYKEGYENWDFNTGWTRAVDYYRKGWQEGLEQAQKARSEVSDVLQARLEDTSTQWNLEPTGMLADPVAALSGAPDCMLVPTEISQPMRVVDLLVPINCPCDMTGEEMMRRGVAIWVLIDHLESQGTRVQVTAVAANQPQHGRGSDSQVEIEVKKPGSALQPIALLYALAHPAFYRRIGFKARETSPNPDIACIASSSHSYGISIDPVASADDQIIIPRLNWDNRGFSILQWLKVMDKVVLDATG